MYTCTIVLRMYVYMYYNSMYHSLCLRSLCPPPDRDGAVQCGTEQVYHEHLLWRRTQVIWFQFLTRGQSGSGSEETQGGGGLVTNYADFLFVIVSFSSQRRLQWCTSRGRSSVSEWLTSQHTSPHLCCRYPPLPHTHTPRDAHIHVYPYSPPPKSLC